MKSGYAFRPRAGHFASRLRPQVAKPGERGQALPNSREIPHRPHRAVTRAADHNQARIDLLERVIVDVETVYRARRVVLHDDICLTRKPPEQLLPFSRV